MAVATRRLVLLLAALLLAPAPGRADTVPLHVLAAATLKSALDAVVEDWQRTGGAPVTRVYGPTPALAKQIENGAPADLFFSADPDWMDYLGDRHLIRAGTSRDVVGNRLVLVAAAQSQLAATIAPGFPLASLLGDGRLAMCDPEHDPAGRYGRASLMALGVWSAVEGRLAIAENVRVAVAMVGRGEAPLAIAFATDAMGTDGVKVIGSFPDETHKPIRYPAAIVAASTHPEAARFLDYLVSPAGRAAFERFGYRAPQ
jgi:molybdate transport system substrate-binding protein